MIWCTGGMLATTILLLALPRFPSWGKATEDAEPVVLPAAVVAGLIQ